MSAGWYLFLFLFILGITAQTVNQFGIPSWEAKYPSSQFTMDTSTINSSQTATTSASLTIVVIYSWVVTFLTIIGSGIVAVISLGGLFYGMGWPVGLAGAALIQLIQLPANLIVFIWLFELWTGRSVG